MMGVKWRWMSSIKSDGDGCEVEVDEQHQE